MAAKSNKSMKKGAPAVPPFTVSNTISESCNRNPIFAVAFSPYQPAANPWFATACKNKIFIYNLEVHTNTFTLVRTIIDDNKDESIFAMTWCYDGVAKQHRLAVAGHCANIKILDPLSGKLCSELLGHGDMINELRLDHNNSMIVASVSKDTTVRVWNINVPVCLIIFAGKEGHHDQVLSCDWSPDSKFLVSCGMDHSIRMWHLNDECRDIINLSMTAKGAKEIRERDLSGPQSTSACVHVPYQNAFNTDIHLDYVDCVRYLDWCVISKGSEKTAYIFRFGHVDEPVDKVYKTNSDAVSTLIHEMNLPDCDVWFLKFDVDPEGKWLVFGTKEGELHFFDLHRLGSSNIEVHNPHFTIPVSETAVRQVCFDKTGQILLAVTDGHEDCG